MLDSRLDVTLRTDGTLYIPQKGINKISLKKLGHMIREGYGIKVTRNLEDGSPIDMTMEVLVKVALGGDPGRNTDKADIIVCFLNVASGLSDNEMLIEDVLYLIIENGGYENFITRKARGLEIY